VISIVESGWVFLVDWYWVGGDEMDFRFRCIRNPVGYTHSTGVCTGTFSECAGEWEAWYVAFRIRYTTSLVS
jgi:hypothetical protein